MLRPPSPLARRWLTLLGILLLLPHADAAPQKGLLTRRTKEAIIKANTSKKVALAVGERIDNFCATFEAFYDELGLEPRASNKVVARVFDTREEYEAHYERGNPGRGAPLAYFSPSANSLFLYNDEGDLTLRQTLFHETSHQFLNRYTTAAPKWLNEGLAEYFEGWRMTADGRLVEKRVNLYDLLILQRALKQDRHLAPRKLVEMERGDFKDFRKQFPELHPYLHYVTSWSLVWYALEMDVEGETGGAPDRERLVRYLRDLNEDGKRARYEVDDWAAFERRWRAAIESLEIEPKDATDFLLLAQGHYRSREYRQATEMYEQALEHDEHAHGAVYGIGLCHKRRGRYDDAKVWLERAREVDPEDPSAPYQLARVHLGIDKNEPPPDADPARALELAEEASELAGGESPRFLELLARCQHATGDGRRARRTAKKILKLVEDEDRPRYERLLEELSS